MNGTIEPQAKRGTNYRAKRTFGEYPEGTVFPRWRLAVAGDVDEMVARKMVEPTTDPVTVKFEVPKVAEPPREAVPDADTQKKLNETETELESLRTVNAALEGKVAELERSQHARLVEWGTQTDRHAFERATDRAAVHAAQESEAAVRKELATAYDRIADLEKKVAAVEKSAAAKKEPKAKDAAKPADPTPTE